MAPPSQLAIATGAVNRLVKEEASYYKELEQQQARIANIGHDKDDENAEYKLKQEQRAIEETKAVFPQLQQRIKDSLAKLQQQLEQEEHSSSEDIAKAKEAVAAALQALKETS
ncbi:hypothetical protein AAFC00_001148 [Neodothiora populina]|uniref:Tubulin-specific chaperone A n=1 Tax=Neodothiora populina TaxID=2781224 RepID=A0ABR3PMZ8_9PEZI